MEHTNTKSSQAEPSESVFVNCSAEHVFSEISKKITKSEVQTLWMRLQDEIQRQGVGASKTYLGGEFTRLKEELTRELSAATN